MHLHDGKFRNYIHNYINEVFNNHCNCYSFSKYKQKLKIRSQVCWLSRNKKMKTAGIITTFESRNTEYYLIFRSDYEAFVFNM